MVSQVVPLDPVSAQLAVALAIAATVVVATRRLRPAVDRVFFAERVALEGGAARLLRDLSDCTAPGEVTMLIAERIASLLRPDILVSYARTDDGFAPVFIRGARNATAFASRTPLIVSLEARAAPVIAAEWRDPRRGLDVSDADRAALAALSAAVVVPVRRGRDLTAFVCLGAKRSGDVYTSTDLSLLSAIAERASAELLRFRDAEIIAETRAMVDALRDEKEAADRASAAKSRFLAAASHDLRQPLHALGLFTEALRDEVHDPQAAALVEKIRASARSMEDMFNAVLDLSKLDAGVVEPSVSDFAVGPLLQRLRAESLAQAEAKEVGLTLVPTTLVVRSDPLLLSRILQNLITNALRYTDRGQVLIGCRRRGQRVRIEVWDTGRGIPRARQGEIFEEYHRLPQPPTGGGDGSGLGLSIVQRLAAVLGHEIALRSEPGRGSTFSVTVPRADRAEPAAPPPASFGPDLTGVRVAVVDDDPVVCDAMQQILTRWRCIVLTYSSAEALLQTLGSEDAIPDVIIADQELHGGLNGIEVIAAIRATAGRAVPACLVTGDTTPARLREARAGGVPLLHKPVAPAKLRAVLAELLRV
jgi:signal transduction histidine kinase